MTSDDRPSVLSSCRIHPTFLFSAVVLFPLILCDANRIGREHREVDSRTLRQMNECLQIHRRTGSVAFSPRRTRKLHPPDVISLRPFLQPVVRADAQLVFCTLTQLGPVKCEGHSCAPPMRAFLQITAPLQGARPSTDNITGNGPLHSIPDTTFGTRGVVRPRQQSRRHPFNQTTANVQQ